MEPGNKATCVFNLLHNLQRLGPSPPTLGVNNMMVVSWVITPILSPTKYRVVMPVINPASLHTNKL